MRERMAKCVRVHHGGSIVRTEDGSVDFVGMREDVFLFVETPTLCIVASRVRQCLGWIEEGVKLDFEGRIDVGSSNGPRMKIMAPVGSEEEWQAYVEIVMNSEVRALDLVVRKVVVDGGVGIGCSNEVEIDLTQPSQASVHDGLAWNSAATVVMTDSVGDQMPLIVPNCGDDRRDETLPDIETVPQVAPNEVVAPNEDNYGVATDLVDVPVFGDDTNYEEERAEDSDDDRPIGGLAEWEKEMLRQVITDRDLLVPDCRDLSQGHRAVADGEETENVVPRVETAEIIQKGIIFQDMESMKMWLNEYSVTRSEDSSCEVEDYKCGAASYLWL
ncbi:hypothetical protein EJB05_57669, partial [Eragrostis curvula]